MQTPQTQTAPPPVPPWPPVQAEPGEPVQPWPPVQRQPEAPTPTQPPAVPPPVYPPTGVPPFEAPAPARRKVWPYLLAAALSLVVVIGGALYVSLTNTQLRAWLPGGHPTITTNSGSFEITDVSRGDRFPEGCVEGTLECQLVLPGYQVVLVKLNPLGNADVNDILADGEGAYMVSAQGERTEAFVAGWTSAPDGSRKEGLVGFTPGDSVREFTFHWPGNDPVTLRIE